MINNTCVSIVRCVSYNKGDVLSAIEKTFNYFGGINSIIKKGTKVLLKPNFIRESNPEECAITHPALLMVLAEKVLEMGATPVIGDSPAFGAVTKIVRRAGLEDYVSKHGIEVIELDKPVRINAKCGTKSFPLSISRKVMDMDIIINIPKLKAHGQLLYTAAVKNTYGCVSGKRKAWQHFKSNDDIDWYTEMLLANYNTIKPAFTIVDAIMAMEKHGPTGGVPRQVSLLIGGTDCIAIDRVISEILNVKHSSVPILKTAQLHNIGEQDLSKINIVGESMSSVKIYDFVLPKLIPVGFNIFRVAKSLAKHFWLKSFAKAIFLLLAFSLQYSLYATTEIDRLKNFPAQVTPDDIIHIPTGEKVQFSSLNNYFSCASILYVGEAHANRASHQVQLQVLKYCYEKFGNNIAIGMEMFTRQYQPFLDQWIAGETDEKKFLEDTHWYKEWGYEYNLYKPILDFAREKGIPVLALNAPKDVVKMVSKKGLIDLSDEEKKLLPEVDTSDFFHRVYIEKIIKGHIDRSADIERYNNVQSLWEEYMAQTIVNYLSSWEGKDKKILVFTGNGHIFYDFGIPKRVFRRTFLPYYTICTIEVSDGKPDTDLDPFLTEIPLEPADFIWVVSPLETQKRIYLGVQLNKSGEDKLVIQEISPKSPAEKGGLNAGDIILSIDGKSVTEVSDIINYLQTKKFGDTCTVEIQRNGTKISYSVALFEFEQDY